MIFCITSRVVEPSFSVRVFSRNNVSIIILFQYFPSEPDSRPKSEVKEVEMSLDPK